MKQFLFAASAIILILYAAKKIDAPKENSQ